MVVAGALRGSDHFFGRSSRRHVIVVDNLRQEPSLLLTCDSLGWGNIGLIRCAYFIPFQIVHIGCQLGRTLLVDRDRVISIISLFEVLRFFLILTLRTCT